jgi:HSP20 family molecular chaperone IbpA
MKTDIKENEGGFELDIDLPGYKKEDVKAQLKDGYMTISAETNQEKDDKDDKGKYIRRERYYGTCSRSFYVGEDITEEDIKAKFENGILKVFVPKKEAQPAVKENKFIQIEG